MLTAGLGGSFGILHYALLAVSSPGVSAEDLLADPRRSLSEDLLRRGFRKACNGDYADIALKAQPADGSILCRASAGRVSLIVDDRLVWTQHFDPRDQENTRWVQAARTREVTMISGDHLIVSGGYIDTTAAAAQGSLVMAKIHAEWL
ncbi:hypothetical protein [Pseudarthrobacter enclensis]|uniref:hypothetical protein n=1 Tax=Pseudarthrobacter enclensis TaxID=993070 RepID=UPI003EE0B265